MPPRFLVAAGVDRAGGGPPVAETTQGVCGLLRQVSSSRPRFYPQSLHVGALPPLRCGAPAFFAERHHRRGEFCHSVRRLPRDDAALGPMASSVSG